MHFSQVAELMAVMARNRGLSFCKVVEVIAETTAPLIPMEELLAKIPSQRPFTQPIEVFPTFCVVACLTLVRYPLIISNLVQCNWWTVFFLNLLAAVDPN